MGCPECGNECYVPGLQAYITPPEDDAARQRLAQTRFCRTCGNPENGGGGRMSSRSSSMSSMGSQHSSSGGTSKRRHNQHGHSHRHGGGSGSSSGAGTPTPQATTKSKRMCKDHARGQCKKMAQCYYNHDLTTARPWYWDRTGDGHKATREIRDRDMMRHLQQVLTDSCVSATLGQGRDQVVKMNYSKLELQSAYRVENVALWEQYVALRNAIGDTHGGPIRVKSWAKWMAGTQLASRKNELFLFHGTSKSVSEMVLNNGFDPRYASNGLYGSGVYFAENSSKSDQYCTPEPASDPINGNYYMFLGRAVMGEPFKTDQSYDDNKPPAKPNGTPGQLYDSLVGQQSSGKYREFVVYKGHQAYPEYLLIYKRK